MLISMLPKLEAFHIHNWPIAPAVWPDAPGAPTLTQSRIAYAQSVGQCAEVISRAFARSRSADAQQLKLLCFGDALIPDAVLTANGKYFDMPRAFYIRQSVSRESVRLRQALNP